MPAWVDKDYVAHHAEMMHKVRTLIIPEIDWDNVSFRQALEDLAFKCQRADSNGGGIHFTVDHRMKILPVLPLTYHAKNKTLLEVLKHLSPFRITGEDVYLFYDDGEGLSRFQFYVPLGRFNADDVQVLSNNVRVYNVAPQLAAKGIHVSAATTAAYFPGSQRLVVTGGWETIESVDELLNS